MLSLAFFADGEFIFRYSMNWKNELTMAGILQYNKK